MTRGTRESLVHVHSATSLVAVGALCATLPFQRVSAGPGDLDPAFAESGLYRTWRSQSALSITRQDEDHFLVSHAATIGRQVDPQIRPSIANLITRLDSHGVQDPAFSYRTFGLGFQAVLDTAVQADGKVIVASRSVVRRLLADSSRDATFGVSGSVSVLESGRITSFILDPDGRIVVAGYSGEDLVIKRLTPDGTPDAGFGDAGAFIGTAMGNGNPVVVYAGDGYLVLAHDKPDSVLRCRVLALTGDGQIDTSYGDGGYASLGAAQGVPVTCRSLQALSDGRVQVAGTMGGRAFAVRVDRAGAVVAGFDASAATALLSSVDAGAIAPDDSSVIAGPSAAGESGVRVLRLRGDGSLDDAFGDAGSTWVDVPFAAVNDLLLTSDRGVVLVGASPTWVARLLGDRGGKNRGVIGLKWAVASVAQDSAHATLTVRRTGGQSGAVSVGFRTRTLEGSSATISSPATEGIDFVPVSDHLYWADGDTGDRSILVPMGPDSGLPEEPEAFQVELYDVSGAAIGTGTGTVEIAGDDVPAGFLSVVSSDVSVYESDVALGMNIVRRFGATGPVTVTLTAHPGSAAGGADFAAGAVTVSWADGETDVKYASIPITNDSTAEATESFTVELSNPTGGAALGSHSVATVTILDDDPQTPSSPPSGGGSRSGGGGRLDWLLYALIASAAFRRSVVCARPRRD